MSQQPATNGHRPQSQSKSKSQTPNQSPYQTTLNTLLTHPSGHIFFSPPTSPHKLLLPQSGRNLNPSTPTISSLSLHPTIESILHILNGDLPSAHFLCRHAEVAPKWESMYVHGMLHRVEGDIDNTRAWYGNVKDTEVFRSVWGGDDEKGAMAGEDGEEVPEIAKGGWRHFLDRLERYRDRSVRRQKLKRKSKDEGERPRRAPNTDDDNDKNHLDTSGASPSPSMTSSSTSTSQTSQSQITDWSAEEAALRATSLWEILHVLRYCEQKFGTGVIANAKGEFLGRIESGDERLQKIAESMVTGGEGWRVF